MSFSIRMTASEKTLAESYAKFHSMSLSKAFKRALFERIEDEYDIGLAEEAYDEYVISIRQSRPASDIAKGVFVTMIDKSLFGSNLNRPSKNRQ